jgi:hypothetical protein
MALRAMLVAPAEARPMAVAIVAVRATTLTTMALVAGAVATKTAAVTSAAAAAMVTVEARATATAVTLSAASGSSNGGNGMTMDICHTILPWYADIINVRSNDDGNCALAFDGGNIDRGVADKLIKKQEGVCKAQAAVVDQAAATIANIEAPTIWRTLCLKKIAGEKCHTQGWCLCGRCKKQTTYICSRCTHKTDRSQKQFWFCNPTMVEGSKCFAEHI